MKKVLLFILLGIFMINFVSAAFEFDNVGQYNETTKTITIKNSILGISWLDLDEVGGAQLNTPQNYRVNMGYQKVAEFDLWAYEDYNDVLKNLEFYDKNYEEWDKHKFTRDFDIKYKTITLVNEPIYNLSCILDVCENITIGYQDVEIEDWVKVKPADLKKNDRLTIGIFIEVEKDDYVEWIISIYGVEVTEWATFEESSNATGGGNAGPYTTKTGDIINVSKTINLTSVIKWSGSTPTTVYVQTKYGSDIIDSATFVGNNATFSSPVTLSSGIEYYILFDKGGSNYQQDYKENVGNPFPTSLGITTMIKGVNQAGTNDTKWYRNLDSLWLRTIALELVVLNLPEDNAVINDPLVNFNWTLSPSGSNITNWTLSVFYINGSLQHQHINTSININESVDVIYNDTLFLDESYIWNVEACQLDDTCFIADNQTFTLDTAPPVVNITYPPEGFIVNTPQENITLNYTVIHPVGDLSNCFYNTTSNSTAINISCTLNTTSFLYPATNPNNLTIFVFGNDSANNLGSDNVTIYKDLIASQINITAPFGILDYISTGSNETLNWTVSDAGLDTCWYNYNGTNVTVNCSLNTTEFIIEFNNYNLTFYANDTFSNENSSFTSWGYKIFEINQTFNNMTTEGATEQFTINLVKNSSFQISTINLVYNGTFNSFPYSVSGDEIVSQSSITIPVVISNKNVTFYWNITLDDSSNIITDTNNQTILSINVDNCSSFTNVIYNFTQYDEENKSILSGNNTIELQINLYDTSKTSLLTSFSNKFEGINPVQFCAEAPLLPTVNYSAYVVVKYFVNSTDANNAYSVEYYNILNQTIGNTTIPINIALYNLKVSDTTKFRLTFRDGEYVLAPNILVQVHRQYIQDNDFKIVEIPLTDSNGQTILNLVKNIIIYNFIMVNEAGEVVGTFNSIAAFCSDFSIGDCTINLAPDSLSEDMYDYNEEFDISISDPSYDNSTKKISINFVTGDLTPKNVRMEIVRNNDFGNRSVCLDSLFSASGVLSCDVSSITDTDQFLFISTFVEDDLAKQDTTNLNSNILNFGTLNGAFYAFFFILILITIFTEDRKVLVTSLGLGWVGVISLGLINGKFIGFTSAGIWILISIAIFLWKLNKEDSV